MKKAFLFLMIPFFLFTCKNVQNSNIPACHEIALDWEFLGNSMEEEYLSSTFTLMNNSNHILGNSGWALYFNQSGRGVIPESVTGNVKIDHVNGDLHKISPATEFELEPGKKVTISFNTPGWLIKVNEAPQGPYMVYEVGSGREIAVAIENYHIKAFPALDKIFPGESLIPLPDAGWIYDQNIHQVLLDPRETGHIIPSPLKIVLSGERLTLGRGLMIHYGKGLEREAGYLADLLEQVMGVAPAHMESDRGGTNIIRLTGGDENMNPESEAYSLQANPDLGVFITGESPAGVFYGIQSLLSLLPSEAWSHPRPAIEMDAIWIQDQPAFKYRGMHLDIARNFIEPAAIKKLIQVMAYYKLNKLHLHLTDDEGWRLEIPSLPELTEIGAFRGHTLDSKDHIGPSYGSGPLAAQGVGFGNGFLSRDTFIELLRFAADHHVEVIPEINFPGHARAAIYAMETRYSRLMKEGKEEEALKYRLIDPEDHSRYNSAQNFNDNVICVCQEAPYLFYETVLDDMMAMYEDAGLNMKVIHVGGDEVPRGSWTGSPRCAEFLENHPGVGGSDNLQAYFGERLLEIIKKKNLVMAGWEEVAMKKNDQGNWIPNPELVGEAMIPYVWNSLDENLDLGYRLANAGYPVVLCNVSNFYFDLAYTHHPEEPGQYWGGFVNTRRAFEFVPYDVFKCTLTDRYLLPIDVEKAFLGLEPLKSEAYGNIIGIQGQLWSEMVKGGEMMEYFYLPKLIGLAERAWCGQMDWGTRENVEDRMAAMDKAWNKFANVVGNREMPRLDYLFGGFNYRLPPPGAKIIKGKLHANIDFPGLVVRYTTDGSEPGVNSPVYTDPVEVSGMVRLRSFDTRGRGSRESFVQ